MLAILLVIIGIFLRFVPHAPNFTPVAAIALIGSAYLGKRASLILPLVLMIFSDLALGMHDAVFFTWGGFVLIALIGRAMLVRKSFSAVAASSIVASLVFYVISNLGVWIVGWYPHTLNGLVNCYIMALPFLRDFTLSTLIYSFVFFGVYRLVEHFVKNTKYSPVLLGNG